MKTDSQILKILERLSEVLHTFFSSAVKIRVDEQLNDFEKMQIIQTFRDESRAELERIQAEIGSLEVQGDEGSSLSPLDQAEQIVHQAIEHLSSY